MMQVGITGNIGSGKTTVSKVFELIGIPVFYADIYGRKLLEMPSVIEQLTALFGHGIVKADRSVDRAKLASVVFSDRAALDQLNAVIHPAVRTGYEQWASEQTGPYSLMEAAILFETGYAARFDKTIVVAADRQTRIDRVCKRDGVPAEDVIRRMNNQQAQEELMKLADYIIYNDDNVLVLPQILQIDLDLNEASQKKKHFS
jgi:dephospho-CoA kinase